VHERVLGARGAREEIVSDTVGYVLLASALPPGLLGWDLARRGLNKVKDATEEAKKAAADVVHVVAQSQTAVARDTGPDVAALATANSNLAQTTNDLQNSLGDVREALKGLTGVFAPARVFVSISVLLIVAALFALDVLSVTAGNGS
jgi:hypothetical protein